MRAAVRHAHQPTIRHPPAGPSPSTDRPVPDIATLIALTLGDLINPVDALIIALVEGYRHRDH
jgi:hypothetical protein